MAVWAIAIAVTSGVILRPWGLPEFVWAVTGAAILVVSGLLPWHDAWRGVLKGGDVYLFLIGMMCLAEVARRAGLFDWLAGHAADLAKGSPLRLFTLVYLVGTLVTVFLSNDATAVVLTPAVAAVAKAARAQRALPYLLICAFVANAASFVLPISNPANLVIYGAHMPPLGKWMQLYAWPSLAAILTTYGVLFWTQRGALGRQIASGVAVPVLSAGGRMAAAGLLCTALVLMAASAMGWPLGWPTFAAGIITTLIVMLTARTSPWGVVRGISWGVLPLVAGLFVLVEALNATGFLDVLVRMLSDAVRHSRAQAVWGAGVVVAFACNLMNNLPAGLIAGSALQKANVPAEVTSAVLIGVDLGPNLSVTGSLATILWLSSLRREGETVGALAFLRLGALVMPPALLLALAAMALNG